MRKPALVANPRHMQLSRREPPDSLDFFPTPPWATRALLEHLAPDYRLQEQECWEPCAGEGHMVRPLQEAFGTVHASDVFDYGRGFPVVDFLDGLAQEHNPDWIITNPPFNAAIPIVRKAIELAEVGVAIFVGASFLAGLTRYSELIGPHEPSEVLHFAERVPLHRGEWKPEGDTATLYVWIIWRKGWPYACRATFLPPGQRDRHHRTADVLALCRKVPAPLLEAL